MIEFPSKIHFVPRANGAKEVKIEYTDDNILLKWVPGDKRAKIKKPSTVEDFLVDTDKLIHYYGGYFLLDLLEKQEKPLKFNPAIDYWERWGPLVPVKGKQTEMKLLFDLLEMCLSALVFKYSCIQSNSDKILPLLEGFFSAVENGVFSHAVKLQEKIEIPRYWTILYIYKSHVPKYIKQETDYKKPFHWVPIYQRGINRFKEFNTFKILLKHPPTKSREDFKIFPELKLSWIRECLLQNLAEYLSKQRLIFKASVVGKSMNFSGETDNLLLAYLVGYLAKTENEIKFCSCGCGQIVPSNRMKSGTATRKCYDKIRDREDPKRGVNSWLRTMKSRGQISQKEYEGFCSKVDRLYEKGLNENEIKSAILRKSKGGKSNGRQY